jgi:hypothetical protein
MGPEVYLGAMWVATALKEGSLKFPPSPSALCSSKNSISAPTSASFQTALGSGDIVARRIVTNLVDTSRVVGAQGETRPSISMRHRDR